MTTAPPMNRNGEKGAATDCAGTGVVVEPKEGSGVELISMSLSMGSMDEFIAPAMNTASAIASTGAIRILKFTYLETNL